MDSGELHRPVGRGTLQRFLLDERSRQGRRLAVVVSVLLAVCAVLAWLLWRQTRAQDASVAELTRLQQALYQREQASTATDAEAESLRNQLAALEKRFAASPAAVDWSGLAERARGSLFLCVGVDPKTRSAGIGTAWVVDADKGILVTNAHVALEIGRMPVVRMVQADSGSERRFDGVAVHPRWNDGKGPDLALLRLKPAEMAPPLSALRLRRSTEVQALRPGMQVATLGFPGELAARYLAVGPDEKLHGVIPTFKTGWIGRITGMDGQPATAEASVLVQHSASLSKGTSGSPLFDASGEVVAVSFGGVGSRTAGSGQQAVEMSSAQINFAIRADEVRALIDYAGW